MKSIKPFLNNQFLSSLNNVYFNIKQKSNQNFSGTRKSNMKGSSLDFSDYRNYSLGDDIRRIDWNGFARFDKLFVKIFMEERRSNINIFVDTSLSMSFYENKALCENLMASAFMYIFLKSQDNVNIYTFDNKRKENLSTLNLFSSGVDFLDDINYEGATEFSKVFSEKNLFGLKPGISVLISDFLTEEGIENALKLLLYKKQKVILIQILSKEEVFPEFFGKYKLKDVETGNEISVDVDKIAVNTYKKCLEKHTDKLKEFCKSRGISFYRVMEDENIINKIYEMTN